MTTRTIPSDRYTDFIEYLEEYAPQTLLGARATLSTEDFDQAVDNAWHNTYRPDSKVVTAAWVLVALCGIAMIITNLIGGGEAWFYLVAVILVAGGTVMGFRSIISRDTDPVTNEKLVHAFTAQLPEPHPFD